MAFATADVGFKQQVPHIQNAFLEDPVLLSILERLLPDHVLKEISPDLFHIADWSNTEEADLIKRMEDDQPRLRQYDHWCRRVDDLLVTEAWKKQKEVAAREGIVAIAYERKYGQHSRIYQMAKLMLWTPGAGLYSCPIAMTDGCARVLELLGTPDMKDQVYSRLTSRDPSRFFTSGQWMTERPGGSDVGRTETQAVWNEDLKAWSVSGFKWFSSATDADVTMLLARTHDPDPSIAPGNMKAGSRGLSLYLARVRNDDGKLNGVRIHRLKDKVGTKALPTAELQLEDMVAHQVGATYKGVKNIASILNITRMYCGLNCTSTMQTLILMAKEYARRREVFGALLKDQPLHLATLANMELQYRATAQFTFYCVALMGRIESLDNNLPEIQDRDYPLLRLLTPILKMWSAKNAFAMSQEAMECFGGQGYMEETGIGRMMRDVLVNTIWEGTSNVMSLDVLRVTVRSITAPLRSRPEWTKSSKSLEECLVLIAIRFTSYATPDGCKILESSARGLSLVMADVFAGALLCQHAAWSESKAKANPSDQVAAAAARVDQISGQRWCEELYRRVEHQINRCSA
ncbi:acyl-CoA-dehydrogenase protein [Mortierella sp. GBAus27b]|nr:acyl-CoA-dehydrogenase protein [Mortierella sp. GBAus27b]